MRERDIEGHFVAQIEAAGGLAYKFVSPGAAGVPDRIAILGGRVWFVEVKRPQAPRFLPGHQQRQHSRIRARGGVVEVIRTIEQADDLVRRMLA